jgi:hypothetical protein
VVLSSASRLFQLLRLVVQPSLVGQQAQVLGDIPEGGGALA